MRKSTCCVLVMLFGSWLSSLGQSAPKATFPRVVATFHQYGLTDALPPTTIYTPKKWGTFRVSIVMVGIKVNRKYALWAGELQFLDAAGEDVPTSFAASLLTDVRRTASAEFPIRAKAGTPIKFSTTSSGDTSGSKYNVWVVVEQLM